MSLGIETWRVAEIMKKETKKMVRTKDLQNSLQRHRADDLNNLEEAIELLFANGKIQL